MKYSNFMSKLDNEIGNVSVTENGALGYATSGKAILDMNFRITSYRNKTAPEIIRDFSLALDETPTVAIKWLFFARDIRGGAGERRLFRICMNWFAKNYPDIAKELLVLIPEYGRFDDLLDLAQVPAVAKDVTEIVKTQFISDMKNCGAGKSVSLLAKWMPSENASSPVTREQARHWIAELGVTPRVYRKTLSKLRSYLDVTEVKMSGNEWDEIDYEKVPSRANVIYREAFSRHDVARREQYLTALSKGEAKINAATLFPHEIFQKVDRSYEVLADMEAAWKSLPDYVKGNDSTIVVRDGSGSMTSRINFNATTSCLDVASALSVYFSERCKGAFKDKFITFSGRPQLVDLSNCNSLRAKASKLGRFNECDNTNLEAVFDLILNLAVENRMPQSEIPQNILIISDMEFDSCTSSGWSRSWTKPSKRLFEEIANRYASAGYKLPRLVFWNVCSHTGTIPVIKNDLGVALVSGFSPAIVKMVLSGKLDPFECLLETLNAPRYDAVGEAIKKAVR